MANAGGRSHSVGCFRTKGVRQRMNRLQGKVCLVTGAAGGIGMAIADGFAREGGTVAAADVDRSGNLAAAAQQASADGRRFESFWVDVADEASVELLVS